MGERKLGGGGIGTTLDEVNKLCKFHDYDFYQYKGEQPLNKIARNLVDYEAGKTIFEVAMGIVKKTDLVQTTIEF